MSCPRCESDEIDGGPVVIERGEAQQLLFCHCCELEWLDIYKLHRRSWAGQQPQDQDPTGSMIRCRHVLQVQKEEASPKEAKAIR